MALPIKLNKITIIDIITEFRFSNIKDIEDLFFEIYTKLKPLGYTYDKLPIMEFPPAVRKADPKFKYQPYYRLHKGKHVINIGPNVLAFGNKGYYSGWANYRDFILNNFKDFENIIKDWGLEQSSMRYIDFFEEQDVFDKLTITMALPDVLCGVTHSVDSRVFVNEIGCADSVKVKIQIANADVIAGDPAVPKRGTIIDIDSKIENSDREQSKIVEKLHDRAKTIFFGLLSPALLESLDPEYEKDE